MSFTAEDFEAWKTNPTTMWVLAQIEGRRQAREQMAKDAVYLKSLHTRGTDWHDAKAEAAYEMGRCDEAKSLVELTFEDISDDTN